MGQPERIIALRRIRAGIAGDLKPHIVEGITDLTAVEGIDVLIVSSVYIPQIRVTTSILGDIAFVRIQLLHRTLRSTYWQLLRVCIDLVRIFLGALFRRHQMSFRG